MIAGVRELLEKLHKFTLTGTVLLYLTSLVLLIIGSQLGVIEIRYTLGVTILLLSLSPILFYLRKRYSDSIISIAIVLCYVVFYAVCCAGDVTSYVWTLIFPFGCMLILFFDNMTAILIGIAGFSLTNIVAIVVGYEPDSVYVFKSVVRIFSIGLSSLFMYRISVYMNNTFKSMHRIYQDMSTDHLTGLRNSLYFDEEIRHYVEHDRMKYAFCLIKINEFYRYNEIDYRFGDEILTKVSDVIQHITKQYSSETQVCRQHGGNFIIAFANCDSASVVDSCERILVSIRHVVFRNDDQEVFLSVSGIITDTVMCKNDYEWLIDAIYRPRDNKSGTDSILIGDRLEGIDDE